MTSIPSLYRPDAPRLTVAICTHNPRRDYLERTIAGLRNQTLGEADWEFLLVDNGSRPDGVKDADWNWQPNGRLVMEPKLGLTHARLAAMTAARADVLLFVDDDNVLEPDYLVGCLEVEHTWPMLGIWGGSIVPEFEAPPPAWTRPYWYCLACREVDLPRWTNQLTTPDVAPYGAGFCLRRSVWTTYQQRVVNDPNRLALGRTGTSLASAEDMDLWYECLEMGLGSGLFPELRLTHLIPPNRLKPEYLLRLVEANHYCLTLLKCIRGYEKVPAPSRGWRWVKAWGRRIMQELKLRGETAFERQFRRAWGRGIRRAHQTASQIRLSSTGE